MIDVVMVAHDRKGLVFEALPLLLDCPLIQQVCVIDNASSDSLAEEGPRRFPEVDWILLEANEGCVAWNRGARRAISPYVLILDDDCVPDLDSLRAASEHLDSDPRTAMAVFNILNAWSGRSEWGFLEPLDGSTGWPNALGACLLVRVEAFLKVGGYKDFFLCFNDLELVLALWEAGFRVVYDRRWKAFHKRPPSGRDRRFYFEVRNFTATVWRHFDSLPGLVVIANYAARALWEARVQGKAQTVVRAVRDGLRLGPRLCSERRGTIPSHVRFLFYVNFLWGRRLARGLPRAGTPPGSGSLRTRVRSAD